MTLTASNQSHRIAFRFDLNRALLAMAQIVDALGEVDKAKLIKLLYIADKSHFLSHGYPITGDTPLAMKWGPVPCSCLEALDGVLWPDADAAFRYLHVVDDKVMLRHRPDGEPLSENERATLRQACQDHGHKQTWDLVRETREFSEYKEAYVEGAATPIPFESILEHSGDESKFRLGRPVVTPEMAAHMVCPFPAGDADL